MAAAPSEKTRVLLVGTFAHQRTLEQSLARRGYEVVSAGDAAAALPSAATEQFDAIAVALGPETSSIPALPAGLMGMLSEAELVLVTEGTPHASLDRAAFLSVDHLASLAIITGAVARAAESARRKREVASLRDLLAAPEQPLLVGTSAAMKETAALVERFAAQDGPVLILGERGTEKETVARAIHARSARSKAPFVVFRAAALTPESQAIALFGQEKGSARGAARERRGRMELAEGGTVLVDEIASLGPEPQAALVAFLKHGMIRRVGSTRSRVADVRIMAGASMPLAQSPLDRAIVDGLGPMTLSLAPLRERKPDIEALAKGVLKRLAPANGATRTLSPGALATLEAYNWPGNVRELEIVLERALMAARGPEIGDDDLGLIGRQDLALAAAQERHVRQVLEAAGGNKSRAAEMLGITRRQLYHLLGRSEAKA